MDAKTLVSIYWEIGTRFNIPWVLKNSPLISDLGHFTIYFVVTLISLWSHYKTYKITTSLLILLVAANEVSQIFILSRQASWYDFSYGVLGIIIAQVVIYHFRIKYNLVTTEKNIS